MTGEIKGEGRAQCILSWSGAVVDFLCRRIKPRRSVVALRASQVRIREMVVRTVRMRHIISAIFKLMPIE